MPGPGLVGRCGYESDPGLPGTDDAELKSSKWLRCGGSVRYGYREMKWGCSLALGNNRPLPARLAVDLSHPNPRA